MYSQSSRANARDTSLVKTKQRKRKKKKEKVGVESGHGDNFPGLLKICMVREN